MKLKHAMLALALCFAGHLTAMAQGSTKALMVQLKAGDTHYYVLAEQPVVTFDGEMCHIASSTLSTDYNMADIDFAKVVGNSSAVDEITSTLTVEYITPDVLAIRGLEGGSRLSLHKVDGVKVADISADDAGSAEVSLSSYPTGVYILSCKEKTFKILHK